MRLIVRFIRNRDGATAIEYGLIAALIGILIIAGMSSLSTSILTMFSKVENNVQ